MSEQSNDLIRDASKQMNKVIDNAKDEFAAIRTGRANPALLKNIVVDYYGSPTPLSQMASINASESRLLVVTPYDKSQVDAAAKAIADSDLGVNPSKDGSIIRVSLPEMTGERRNEYIKLARSKAEAARVSIRNIRHHIKDVINKQVKAKELGEDVSHRLNNELDGKTKAKVAVIDEMLEKKEKDLKDV